MERKAQASTEYLVILAVVIVVAVVVVGIMTNFIPLGGQTSDKANKIYWQNAEIGLLDWLMSSDGQDSLVVRNNGQYDIYIQNITVDTASSSVNETLAVGQQKTVRSDWVSCNKGSPYSYSVSFLYDNAEFNLTGKTFAGIEKIVGNCQ